MFFDSLYKIMLRMLKDKLAIKFIKIIPDNYVVSDSEKEKRYWITLRFE